MLTTAADAIAMSQITSPAKPIILVSAVALIDRDGRVLLAQRPAGRSMAGLWEFPGGKVESGETPEAALIRELDEELRAAAGFRHDPVALAAARVRAVHALGLLPRVDLGGALLDQRLPVLR